jgi:hypothetical protein
MTDDPGPPSCGPIISACGEIANLTRDLAAALNQSCFCITLDRESMAGSMRVAAGDTNFYDAHIANRPHLFSNVPVFLPELERQAMLAIVRAIEETSRTQPYREASLAWAPMIARQPFGPVGVFMGYDFHLGSGPPRLIEINTNAGGAFLNAFSARAQLACCDQVEFLKKGSDVGSFDAAAIAMFESEWRRQRGSGRPTRIAIVDDAPTEQYLYPEFLLAQKLFASLGIEAVVLDPGELTFTRDQLWHDGMAIDLVYNRLVDFALAASEHAALREAYVAGSVVVTPNPHTHALLADKRNLTLLTDMTLLESWGISSETRETLSSIPSATLVREQNAAQLWTDRKKLFFKPTAGYGGKAVYRGDKLTRSTWAEILTSDYIAQEFAPPGERQVMIEGAPQPRKMDVRLYTYDGQLVLAAARLYQGQTTNFRTEGGGFAPVYFV